VACYGSLVPASLTRDLELAYNSGQKYLWPMAWRAERRPRCQMLRGRTSCCTRSHPTPPAARAPGQKCACLQQLNRALAAKIRIMVAERNSRTNRGHGMGASLSHTHAHTGPTALISRARQGSQNIITTLAGAKRSQKRHARPHPCDPAAIDRRGRRIPPAISPGPVNVRERFEAST